MIDLANQTVHVPGFEPEPIQKWEVWFVTLDGLTKDIPKDQPFVPVPVAIGVITYEAYLGVPFHGKEALSPEGSSDQSGEAQSGGKIPVGKT